MKTKTNPQPLARTGVSPSQAVVATYVFSVPGAERCVVVVGAQSCPALATPRTAARQALCPWNLQAGIPEWVDIPSPGDLPDPGMEPDSPALQADCLRSEPPGKAPRGCCGFTGRERTWASHVAGENSPLNRLCARSVSCSVVSSSLLFHGLEPTRLLCPWDFPGKNTGASCLSFLHGIFPTQGLNLCLLYCRQILYRLSHQRSPMDFVEIRKFCTCVLFFFFFAM